MPTIPLLSYLCENNSNIKKGNPVILIVLTILIIVTIIFLIYNGTIKTPFINNKLLSCNISELGAETKIEFNGNDRIIKVITNQKYSDVPKSNINKDFPTNYIELKTYFLDLGYTRNGEVGKKKDDNQNSNNENNQNTNTSKLYSINEKINTTNNLFEYKDYGWSSSFEDSASYQKETNKEINKDDPFWEV